MIVVFLPMGAITEVILVYEYLHGDAKFSREFCTGIPNSLQGILHGDSEFSIGNFEWGFRIL